MQNPLTPSLERSLLACLPAGTQILSADPYRPAYSTFPALLNLQASTGKFWRCVVKVKSFALIALEIKALNIAGRVGLPVPELLSDLIDLSPDPTAAILMSELPGRPLPWCGLNSLSEADGTCCLLLEAVDRFHDVTTRVQELKLLGSEETLPRHTVEQEYADTTTRANKWMEVKPFEKAVQLLQSALAKVKEPLVFSNGDYNPLNLLSDRNTLCGFVDFEAASFENPQIGFAKFLIWKQDTYGWGTAAMTGLVERSLYSRGVSRLAFAPILVLRCLRHLIQEVSIHGSKDQRARKHIFHLVERGLLDLS